MRMGFLLKRLKLYEIIYKIDGKESRSIQLAVLGLSYFKEFRKDKSLVPYYLILTSMIIFFLH